MKKNIKRAHCKKKKNLQIVIIQINNNKKKSSTNKILWFTETLKNFRNRWSDSLASQFPFSGNASSKNITAAALFVYRKIINYNRVRICDQS